MKKFFSTATRSEKKDTDMTSRERMMRAIRREQSDRVFVTVHL